jgi:hypothetical protein
MNGHDTLHQNAANHDHCLRRRLVKTAWQTGSLPCDRPPERLAILLHRAATSVCSHAKPWFNDALIGSDMIFFTCAMRFDHQWWRIGIHVGRVSEHRDVKFQDETGVEAINVR